jgi:hypothetical protein
LNREKIFQKKPKDSIRQKTPANDHLSDVKGKTPQDTGEDFSLPPRRVTKSESIPKSDVKVPSNHGSQKIRQKDISPVNKPPIRKSNDFKTIQSKQPGKQGKILQKIKIQSKTPKKTIKERQSPPSRKGIDESKKSRRSINKPLSKQIRSKTPSKTSVRLPPATSQLEKKKQDRTYNQPPPPKITHKKPSNRKQIPPPTVKEKIPKTKIKDKKPK